MKKESKNPIDYNEMLYITIKRFRGFNHETDMKKVLKKMGIHPRKNPFLQELEQIKIGEIQWRRNVFYSHHKKHFYIIYTYNYCVTDYLVEDCIDIPPIEFLEKYQDEHPNEKVSLKYMMEISEESYCQWHEIQTMKKHLLKRSGAVE